MPITRREKEQMVQEIKEKMESSQVIILTDYKGLNVEAMTKLRSKLRGVGSEIKVTKNTMTKLAANEMNLQDINPYLEGPVALTFGFEDPVAPAKALSEFAKEYKQLEIKAGILDGRIIDPQGIKALADLPSRDVLLAKVLGGMQSPMYGFAGALQGLLRNLVYVVDAVREKKAEEAAS